MFVDSDVFVDWVAKRTTPHPDTGEERWKSAERLFAAILDERVKLCSSALIEAEVTCNGDVKASGRRAKDRLAQLFVAPGTDWTDVDRLLVRDAVPLAEP